MSYFFRKYSFKILILSVLAMPLFSQNSNYFDTKIEEHSVNEKKWKESLSEVTYESQRNFEEEEMEEEERAEQKNFEANVGAFFKVLLIVAAIGIVAFFIIQLIEADNLFGPKNKKIKANISEINLESIEENLYESDLDKYIHDALKGEEYTLAIRLYYLAILKNLSLSNQIKWKKDKTNGEYVREMEGKENFNEFREVTQVFDKIWYGKMELNQTTFDNISPKFKVLAEKN